MKVRYIRTEYVVSHALLLVLIILSIQPRIEGGGILKDIIRIHQWLAFQKDC